MRWSVLSFQGTSNKNKKQGVLYLYFGFEEDQVEPADLILC